MRMVSELERRSRLVAQHRLAGDASGPEAVVESMLALHATDPATVYLSVLARSRSTSLGEIAAAMYDRRALVRWMAMRRTLFVFDRTDIPVVQAAVSTPLGAMLRRQLVSRIQRNGIDPPVDGDLARWLDAVEAQVEQAVAQRGSATGAEVRRDVPALGASIPARTRSESPQSLTSPLLTAMSAAGRLVRGSATGAWTSRGHRWEPAAAWWPGGIHAVEQADAEATLARRWLERFAPATVEDLQWWTGWNLTTTRRAIASLDIEEVDLHGRSGLDLPDREPVDAAPPVAALLPALDPTPMGWKHREWFTAIDPTPLYDRAGNIGPTVWWDGELVGGWAGTPTGIRVSVLADRGRAAAEAIEAAAAQLHERIGGAVVTPAARTPLERALVEGSMRAPVSSIATSGRPVAVSGPRSR